MRVQGRNLDIPRFHKKCLEEINSTPIQHMNDNGACQVKPKLAVYPRKSENTERGNPHPPSESLHRLTTFL
jgi:hypothetical protein